MRRRPFRAHFPINVMRTFAGIISFGSGGCVSVVALYSTHKPFKLNGPANLVCACVCFFSPRLLSFARGGARARVCLFGHFVCCLN